MTIPEHATPAELLALAQQFYSERPGYDAQRVAANETFPDDWVREGWGEVFARDLLS